MLQNPYITNEKNAYPLLIISLYGLPLAISTRNV